MYRLPLLCFLQVLFISASGCQQQPSVRLTASPNGGTLYLSMGQLQQLNLRCDVFNVGPECYKNGNLTWRIPAQFESRTVNSTRSRWSSDRNVTSLGVEDSGNYIFTCTYTTGTMTWNDTHSLRIKALPYQLPNPGTMYIQTGKRAEIECPLYPGNPPSMIHWQKNGRNISEFGDEFTITEKGRKLVTRRADHRHSGSYLCEINSNTPTSQEQVDPQLITVVVQDAVSEQNHSRSVTFGEKVEIACTGPQNQSYNVTWKVEKDDIMMAVDINSNGHYSVSRDEMTLQINSISEGDIGSRVVCSLQNNVSQARQTTTLLLREYLSVCTEREENTDRIQHVVQETLLSLSCGHNKDCVQTPGLEVNRNEEAGHGVYEVRGWVSSPHQAVKVLNTTLQDRGDHGYKTHGLTIRLSNCTQQTDTPTSDPPSLLPTPRPPSPQVNIPPRRHPPQHHHQLAGMVAGAAVLIVVIVCVTLLILCRRRRGHTSRGNAEEGRVSCVVPVRPSLPPTQTQGTPQQQPPTSRQQLILHVPCSPPVSQQCTVQQPPSSIELTPTQGLLLVQQPAVEAHPVTTPTDMSHLHSPQLHTPPPYSPNPPPPTSASSHPHTFPTSPVAHTHPPSHSFPPPSYHSRCQFTCHSGGTFASDTRQ